MSAWTDLRDAQQRHPVCHCSDCCGELYKYDIVFRWEERELCKECFKDIIIEWVKSSPAQVADALMVETEEV